MSEEKNSQQSSADNQQSHFPEDPGLNPGHAPQLQTPNPEPQTKEMEVHHHSHAHGKKNWKTYFWEFLMLFLAVFCGFLAENQREHYIEHKREKQYARQLLADLRKDSVFFSDRKEVIEQTFSKSWIKDLFVQEQGPTDAEIIRSFLKVFWSFDVSVTNTTFNQMKSSGSLRYIQDAKLTAELQHYYDVLLERVITQSAVSRNYLNDYMLPWYIRHLKAQDIDGMGDSVLNAKALIIDRTDKTDQEVLNITDTYRLINISIHERIYKPAALQINALISMIKKEYHLE